MKAIILAGGSGSRLHPLTLAVSKQLLPVYNKPMIYYPLATLMQAGISDFLIITTSRDQPNFRRLLGNGHHLNISIDYCVQDKPRGIADAIVLGEGFIGDLPFCLILGDNFFFSGALSKNIADALQCGTPTVFATQVDNPNSYGVARFDDAQNLVEIIEKPAQAPSNWAITGLYCFDSRAINWAKSLTPSARGELEITDINNAYCREGELNLIKLDSTAVWFDMGTHDALLEAGNFVKSFEKRKGVKLADLEQIAADSRLQPL